MTTTDYILKIITLLGGLALFLFGMDVMGKALERQAGGKLQTILSRMSANVWKGFLLGLGATAVIQSSSATTVMVVGFVNSGIMTLKQAVGVIMGSNVGTTVTAWILSLTSLEGDSLLVQLFKPTTLAPLLGIIGIVLTMFSKKDSRKGVGTILLGFMALMTGMDLMSGAMKFLEGEDWFRNLMIAFSNNPILGVLMGAVLTAIIQSSSASVGILQGLSATGLVTYGTAIPIILGQNIGTCVTALISTVGANRNARRTAMVHLYFNIIGVTLFMIIFYTVNAIFPWEFLTQQTDSMGIAVVHTCFNLLTTMVLMPLNSVLVKLATLTVRDAKQPEHMELLDERLLATPAVAVSRAFEITCMMARNSLSAFSKAMGLTHSYSSKEMEKLRALEEETDHYEDALGTYLVRLSESNLAPGDNCTLNTMLYTIGDFERIADHAVSLGAAGKEITEKSMKFSPNASRELEILERAVTNVMEHTVEAFTTGNTELAMKIEPREQVVDELVREIKSRHIRRVRSGQCTVEYGFVLEDMLNSFSRIADHCSNIAVEMLQVAQGKMEAHEYLGALKAGTSSRSAAFDSEFAACRQEYWLPAENE